MKKKNLKILALKKKSISNFQPEINGGKIGTFTFFCTTSIITLLCQTQFNDTCYDCLSDDSCRSIDTCTA
ncbi:hypothetical protein [Kordia sp.]|uniref:hypothetical protein n=1 Tax=Kordia sp. TaxID=1965332 RepID=UPI003D2A3652